jgi:hypothetical protein
VLISGMEQYKFGMVEILLRVFRPQPFCFGPRDAEKIRRVPPAEKVTTGYALQRNPQEENEGKIYFTSISTIE